MDVQEYLLGKDVIRGMSLLDPRNMTDGKHDLFEIFSNEKIININNREGTNSFDIELEFSGKFYMTYCVACQLDDFYKLKESDEKDFDKIVNVCRELF